MRRLWGTRSAALLLTERRAAAGCEGLVRGGRHDGGRVPDRIAFDVSHV